MAARFLLDALPFCLAAWLVNREIGRTRASAHTAFSLASLLESCLLVASSRTSRAVWLAAFCESLRVFGSLTHFPLYLSEHLSVSTVAAGVTTMGFAVGGLAFSCVVGRPVEKVDAPMPARCGGAVAMTGMIAVKLASSLATAFGGCLALSFGFFRAQQHASE